MNNTYSYFYIKQDKLLKDYFMKKVTYTTMVAALLLMVLAACGNGNQKSAEGENVAGQTEETATEVGDVVRGELGAFELRGPVKECVWNYGNYERTYTFDESGMWATRDGNVPWEGWPSKRDDKGRIIYLGDGDVEEVFEYNDKGLRTVYAYHDLEYGYKTYYTYDENDEVIEVKDVNWYNNEESNPRVSKFKILERDSHGNWTKRDIGKGVISTRQISYFE